MPQHNFEKGNTMMKTVFKWNYLKNSASEAMGEWNTRNKESTSLVVQGLRIDLSIQGDTESLIPGTERFYVPWDV